MLFRSGESTDVDFKGFLAAAKSLIKLGDPDPAFLWDRVGHWAQYEDDWPEAEKAYRKAYELEPDQYGYCLGTALNSRKKYAEALPILLKEAEQLQSDAMSWFQVAISREGTGDIDGCISAYEKALKLDPDYALAWYNLGGIHWNRGDIQKAVSVWSVAAARFPVGPEADQLREILPDLFEGQE